VALAEVCKRNEVRGVRQDREHAGCREGVGCEVGMPDWSRATTGPDSRRFQGTQREVLARQPSPNPRPGSSSRPSAAVLQQRLCATVEGDDDQAPSLTVGVTLLAEHHFRQSLQFGMSHSHRIAVTPPRPPLHCSDAALAVIFSS
jgi:hypothetical protein